MAKVRIQKVLSSAGLASRRAVEQMVLDKRITVNGRTLTQLPCFVEPTDEILVDGQTIRKSPQRKAYILLNKPRGVVCTQKDHPGSHRPRAVDLVPGLSQRVYCVGRLDEDSTGLIILTNDGELTNRLTHPRYGVPKTYVVHVAGRLDGEDVGALRRGVFLDRGRTSAARVRLLRRGAQESLLGMKISEGRNRQVRRMLARLGHKVRRLHRSAIGGVTDRGLKIGNYRHLKASELASLRKLAGL